MRPLSPLRQRFAWLYTRRTSPVAHHEPPYNITFPDRVGRWVIRRQDRTQPAETL